MLILSQYIFLSAKNNKIKYLGYSNISTKRVTRYFHIRFTYFKDIDASKVLRKRLIC